MNRHRQESLQQKLAIMIVDDFTFIGWQSFPYSNEMSFVPQDNL